MKRHKLRSFWIWDPPALSNLRCYTIWAPPLGTEAGVPGSSMLSVSVCRLKGSVGEFSKCRRMMERSMMVPEGSRTGSVIRVSIRGSAERKQSERRSDKRAEN